MNKEQQEPMSLGEEEIAKGLDRYFKELEYNWLLQHPKPDETICKLDGCPVALVYFNPFLRNHVEWKKTQIEILQLLAKKVQEYEDSQEIEYK